LIDRVGLGSRARHRPAQLSGGECQRVAVARALAADPKIVLADEPTGNLDTGNGDRVLSHLRELTADHGAAVVLVTHDPHAARYADRVCELRDGSLRERPLGELLAALSEG
jgi:ABC-type lipoprotein export system ATPase subunit